MWPFIQPVWGMALLSLLIAIPLGSLDATVALFLKPYTDIVIVGKDMSAPWYIPILIVSFTLIQGVLLYFSAILNTWVGGKISMRIKRALYDKLVTLDAAYFDTINSGTILVRFSQDADVACAGLINNFKTLVTRVFSSLALIAVLFYNSWHLSLIAVMILLIALTPLTKVAKLIKKTVSQNIVSSTELNTNYNETFSGHKTITAYNLQEDRKVAFINLITTLFRLSMHMMRKTAWLSPFMHFIVSIGIGLAVALGSWLIVNNTITAGNFVSFLAALIMLYTPLRTMGNSVVSLQNSFFAIDRIFEIFNQPLHVSDKEDALELKTVSDGLKFENVSFAYTENNFVLNNINLQVKKGETLALIGNSGGGKSTIANLIPRFYEVTKGKITVDGHDIRDVSMHSLRDQISLVFQDNFLFNGTIRENIMYGKKNATEEELRHAVESAYITQFTDKLPNGLDTEVGERGILLSGGQKQRVAIARALLKNAPIIVLDEATSALDNKSEQIVQQAIDNLMEDKTVIVIAHRLSTIKNAHKIAVIHEGQCVEYGSHQELMDMADGHYQKLYAMQFTHKNPTQNELTTEPKKE